MQVQLTRLEKLCMSGNKECSGEDLKAIAPPLAHLARLTHLDLFNYDIMVRSHLPLACRLRRLHDAGRLDSKVTTQDPARCLLLRRCVRGLLSGCYTSRTPV